MIFFTSEIINNSDGCDKTEANIGMNIEKLVKFESELQ